MSVNSRCPACRQLPIGSCDKCKKSKAASQRLRRERLLAAGCCMVCGNPATDDRCDDCKKRQRENLKELPCKGCGAERGTKPFISTKNICKECYKARGKIHRSKISKEVWRIRHQRVKEASFSNWLRSIWYGCKDSRRNKRRGILCTVTLEHLLFLLEKQGFRCALTKLKLTHKTRDLRSASIDRIDSNGHYEIGNVQIVCKAINFAKSNSTNAEIILFIKMLREPIEDTM